MESNNFESFFGRQNWYRDNGGPRYLQLFRYVYRAIQDGELDPDTQLPPEREFANLSGVSRVTIRKAIAKLVEEGAIHRLQGSGSYIRKPTEGQKLEHPLSTLTSFTDYMRIRGISSSSEVLMAGSFPPIPDEIFALGIGNQERVARIERLRSADGSPMALETSSVPLDVLPDPQKVKKSLYDILRQTGLAPVRAVQRISALNITRTDAEKLGLSEGQALLQIDRTGYLANGRPVEFTRGLYRSEIYDFVAELQMKENEP